MHTTATLHVHPACASNPRFIAQLQASTGGLVVIHCGKPKLVTRAVVPMPFDPNDGPRAA